MNLLPFATKLATVGILGILRLVTFQMALEILCRFPLASADAAFEILSVLMCAHMPINEKARRKVLSANLAAAIEVLWLAPFKPSDFTKTKAMHNLSKMHLLTMQSPGNAPIFQINYLK